MGSDLESKLWANVRVVPCGGCWEWEAGRSKDGYGTELVPVSHTTLWRLVKAGRIRSVKLGGRRLFPVSVLDELEAHAEGGEDQ